MKTRMHIMKLLPALLFTGLLGGSWVYADGVKIIAFGDSTTAFRKGRIDKVYSIRLQEALVKKNIDANVINEGVGGSHTGVLADNRIHKCQHARDRFQTKIIEAQPDVVIMQFGINDSYVDQGGKEGNSRISLEQYHNNLTHMVEALKNADIVVILMTPNPFGSSKETWRNERLLNYAGQMRKVALEQNVPLVDVWEIYTVYAKNNNVDCLLLDGVHPNDTGHRMLTEKLVPVVIQSLKAGLVQPGKRAYGED